MDAERGCIIPVLQSAVIGVLSGALVLAVGQWQEWSGSGWMALASGSGAALLTFVSGVARWRASELALAPRFTPDPEPVREPEAASVRVELSRPLDGGSHQLQLAQLPATFEQLRDLADGVLSGAPFAESAWCGSGRPFSRAEFGAVRAEFMRRNWCAWRRSDAPGQGVIVTGAGRAVLRSFASETVALTRRVDER